MSLAGLLTRDCTIIHRSWSGSPNAYGNQTATETTAATVCELQQQQRTENPDEVSETGWLLILPAGTVIATGDTVTVDGLDYEVVGEPWPTRNPRTGIASHIEATVQRASSKQEA